MTFANPFKAHSPGITTVAVPHPADERAITIPDPDTPPPPRLSHLYNFLLPHSKFLDRCTTLFHNNVGLLLVASAQAGFALMNTAVKKLDTLDPPVHSLEVILVRMVITYICCISYMYWAGVPDPIFAPKGVRLLLALRGIAGFTSIFGVYYSLQYLSLSDATVLTFLAPSLTALAGCLILGETFSRREAVAGLLSLVGVVLIARPQAIFGAQGSPAALSDSLGIDGAPAPLDPAENTTPVQRLVAVGVALLGVLGATCAYITIRAIGKRAHALHSLASLSAQSVIAATAGIFILRVPMMVPSRIEWLALLIMIGTFGFLAQALLTLGLQRETAGRGTMAVPVQIIFATILEGVFFHTVPSPLSIIGAVIIVGSAIYIALIKVNTHKGPSASAGGTAPDVPLDLEDGLLQHDELAADGDDVESKSVLEKNGHE